jgi:hypothetical protein
VRQDTAESAKTDLSALCVKSKTKNSIYKREVRQDTAESAKTNLSALCEKLCVHHDKKKNNLRKASLIILKEPTAKLYH